MSAYLYCQYRTCPVFRSSYLPTGLSPALTLSARSSQWDSTANQAVYGAWSSVAFTYQAPAVASVVQLNLLNVTSTSPNTTSDPTLVGDLAGPGNTAYATVEFDYNNGTIEGYATTDADGNFTFTPAGLPNGAVTVPARVLQWDPLEAQYDTGTWTLTSFTYMRAPSVSVGVTNLHLLDPDTSASGLASQQAAIGGTVTTSSGSSGYLEVQVDTNGDGTPAATFQTDANGNFSCYPQGLSPGPVTLDFRAQQWDYVQGGYVWSAWTPFTFTLESSAPWRRPSASSAWRASPASQEAV